MCVILHTLVVRSRVVNVLAAPSVPRARRVGDYDDDIWLNSRIGLRVPGFRADFPASLHSDDIEFLG
jgi:hypothetical protein